MIWIIGTFCIGYIFGMITIACFAVRNYSRGYDDGLMVCNHYVNIITDLCRKLEDKNEEQ